MKTYWEHDGKYQAQYEVIFSKLVPAEGEAKTHYGEVLRVMSNIYYDRFNNGGWNTGREQLQFLMDWANLTVKDANICVAIWHMFIDESTDAEYELLANEVIFWTYQKAVADGLVEDYQI